MKTLEKREIVLLISQFVGISLLFLLSNIFWLLFVLNLGLLAFSIFWIFDLKPEIESLKKNYFFLVMPVIYFLGIIFFMTTVKNVLLQLLVLGLYIISNHFFIRHMACIKEGSEECSTTSRNIVSMIILVMVFLTTTDLLNAYIFYKIPLFVFMILIFGFIFLITYFLFLQYDLTDKRSRLHIFFASFGIMQILWVGTFWQVNYPKSELGEIGIPLVSILALVCYYTFWGLSHHKLTNTLTKKVLTEYIMISVIIILILLYTTSWIPEGVVS